MLKGKTVIFLSCSSTHADGLARPIRDALNRIGYHAVIVMDEPQLRGTFDPESKVESYIQAADAFVALCTEDSRIPEGTSQNIIDEIARARMHPSLRDVVCVLKEPSVKLPSNINPTWEDLSATDPDGALAVILGQLGAWEVSPLASSSPAVSSLALSDEFFDALFNGVRIGDHELAERRLLHIFTDVRKQHHYLVVDGIFERFLAASETEEPIHVLSSFLEASSRIDPSSISLDRIAQLSESAVFQHRSCAATILWGLAEVAPGIVPLDLVASLARPAHEDWYVFSPALAAAKQLALVRKSAWNIFYKLSRSEEADDRSYAASSAIAIARVDLALVPPDLAKHLANDTDSTVAKSGRELLLMIGGVTEERRAKVYGKFGL